MLAGVAGVLIALDGGADEPSSANATATARPLTAAQARRLALVPLRAYEDTGTTFRASIPTPQGGLALEGRVDFRRGLGYALGTLGAQRSVLQWDARSVVGWPAPASAGSAPPAETPTAPVNPRALSATTSALDSVLVLLLRLGTDRAVDAAALQRSDARFLGDDRVGVIPVEVMTGPGVGDGSAAEGPRQPTTRYWVDADSRLRRLLVAYPSSTVTIGLQPEGYTSITRSRSLS